MNTIKLTFIFLLAALSVLAGSPAAAKDKTSVPVIDSGASERLGLSLVVYNTNLALVREQRRIGKLERLSLLRFGDVPEQLIPSSVVVKSDAGLTVLEQQYQYDLLTVDRLLEKYVGKKVTLERLNARTETPERVSGTLLSLKGGRVIQFEDRVEVDPEGRFILPEVPENFVTRPTLTWLMESGKRSRGGTLDVSYLTRGVSWSCDYLLKLHGPGDGESAGLSGWVTIDNRSGADYADCELHLVAGEIHQVAGPKAPGRNRKYMMAKSEGLALAGAQSGKEAFDEEQEAFEYYRYSLGRVTSLPNLQMKQIELFSVDGLKPRRIYRFHGRGRNLFYARVSGKPEKEKVNVYLEWVNGGANYAGLPLPAGIVRIYREEPGGVSFFSGEDRIGHTPVEEKITIRAGKAFDLVAQRKQTEFKKLSNRLRQAGLEIRITNRKDKPVTVEVDETLPGDWKITSNSHPFRKLDSATVRFSPTVPARGETVVRYTVQIL